MCIIILGNWWYKNFFQQGLIFLENDKNWFSFVFTVLPKHIKINSLLKYKSVCGGVVKPSGLSTALSSYNRSTRGSSLDGARFTHQIFYTFELEYCLPAFHCWFITFHYNILYVFLFSLIWVFVWNILLLFQLFLLYFQWKKVEQKQMKNFKVKLNQMK